MNKENKNMENTGNSTSKGKASKSATGKHSAEEENMEQSGGRKEKMSNEDKQQGNMKTGEHTETHKSRQEGKHTGGKKEGKSKTKTVKYKTNMKCSDCVDKVKSQLNDIDVIEAWTLDLDDPDRILTVVMDEEGDVAVIESIFTGAGYVAELYEY